MGVVRSTFVIDENGVIEKVFEKVKPDTNAQEILEYLDERAKRHQKSGSAERAKERRVGPARTFSCMPDTLQIRVKD